MQDETRWGWSWRHDKAQARWSLDKGPGFAGWKYYGSDFCTLASIQEAENLVPRFARKSGCRRCAYKGWLLPFPHLLSHDRGIFKEQVSWLIAWHSIIARLPCLAWSCLQWTRVRDLVGPGGMRWLGVHSLGGGGGSHRTLEWDTACLWWPLPQRGAHFCLTCSCVLEGERSSLSLCDVIAWHASIGPHRP